MCDPRSPRYREWSLVDNGFGKCIPVIAGNTNEVTNLSLKPHGRALRPLSMDHFDVKRARICNMECHFRSYKLMKSGDEPEFVNWPGPRFNFLRSIKQI